MKQADVKARGVYHYEIRRLDGRIERGSSENIVTDEGRDHLIDVALGGAAQSLTWYLGIFSNNYTPTGAETYLAPGGVETIAYAEASRPTWQCGDVSGGTLTNTSNKASFTFNAAASVYGAFLANDSTKGDSASATAVLYSISQFSGGVKTFESAETLKVWYDASVESA